MSEPASASPAGEYDLEGIIEIRDPEIDVNEIMARIREDLNNRPPLDIDFSALRFESGAGTSVVDDRLAFHLQRAKQLKDKIFVGDQLMAPSGMVSKLLHPLRRQAHQLTRFYVDLLASRQAVVNVHLVDALDELGASHRSALRRIDALEAELATMRAQLDERPKAGSAGAAE